MVKLVYVLGSGHCGSTLLSNVLDAHQSVVNVGEIFILRSCCQKQWNKMFNNRDIWKDIDQYYLNHYGKSIQEIDFLDASFWQIISAKKSDIFEKANHYWTLFECINSLLETSVILDSSKTPQQLFFLRKGMGDNQRNQIKVIHLVRDGRATLNSYFKHYHYISHDSAFKLGINRWIKTNLSSLALRQFFDSRDWLFLRYEDFVLDFENNLQKLCEFIEIDPASNCFKSEYDPSKIVSLGGNPRPYKLGDPIKLDNKWEREMDQKDVQKFNTRAGWLNKLYGYS